LTYYGDGTTCSAGIELGSCCVSGFCVQTSKMVCEGNTPKLGTWSPGKCNRSSICLDTYDNNTYGCCVKGLCFDAPQDICVVSGISEILKSKCPKTGLCPSVGSFLKLEVESVIVPQDYSIAEVEVQLIKTSFIVQGSFNLSSAHISSESGSTITIENKFGLYDSALSIYNSTLTITGDLTLFNSSSLSIDPLANVTVSGCLSGSSGSLKLKVDKSSKDKQLQLMKYNCLSSQFSNIQLDVSDKKSCEEVQQSEEYSPQFLFISFLVIDRCGATFINTATGGNPDPFRSNADIIFPASLLIFLLSVLLL